MTSVFIEDTRMIEERLFADLRVGEYFINPIDGTLNVKIKVPEDEEFNAYCVNDNLVYTVSAIFQVTPVSVHIQIK